MASSNVHFFSWIKAFRGAMFPSGKPGYVWRFLSGTGNKSSPSLLFGLIISAAQYQLLSFLHVASNAITYSKGVHSQQTPEFSASAFWLRLSWLGDITLCLEHKNSKTHKQTNKRKKKKTLHKSNLIFCFLKILTPEVEEETHSVWPVFDTNQFSRWTNLFTKLSLKANK